MCVCVVVVVVVVIVFLGGYCYSNIFHFMIGVSVLVNVLGTMTYSWFVCHMAVKLYWKL